MSETMTKEDAHKLVDMMPEGSTWDEFIHKIYVRESIEKGIADSKAGRTRNVSDIREKYGLPK